MSQPAVPEPVEPTEQLVILPPPVRTPADTLRARALSALSLNMSYLAISAPTGPQSAAQVAALTRQVNALIRLVIQTADTTTGT